MNGIGRLILHQFLSLASGRVPKFRLPAHHFSSSAVVAGRLRGKLTAKQVNDRLDRVTKAFPEEIEDVGDKDTTSMGHVMLSQQRQLLHYMRLIEHEIPELVGVCSLHAIPVQPVLSIDPVPCSLPKTVYPPTTHSPSCSPVHLVWRRTSYGYSQTRDCRTSRVASSEGRAGTASFQSACRSTVVRRASERCGLWSR